MFTWICPQCGREVPPSYTECPDCAKRAAEPKPDPTQAAPPPPPPPPPPQQYAPPPPSYGSIPPAHPQYQAPPYQPQYAPPPQYLPPRQARGGLPTWAMAILFSFAIFGVVAGIYWLVGSGNTAKPSTVVESPAAKSGGATNPYQKYIEVSGIRFVEDPKKKGTTQARFIVVNHSNADIPGLSGNVTVWGRTRASEEDAAGTFTFTTDLKSYESKEMTVPFTTKRKIYELPDDWQNTNLDIQITKP